MIDPDDFGPGEYDYVRLTTVGKIDVVQPIIGDIQTRLGILGLEGEAASLAHAYEALYSAQAQLRPETE